MKLHNEEEEHDRRRTLDSSRVAPVRDVVSPPGGPDPLPEGEVRQPQDDPYSRIDTSRRQIVVGPIDGVPRTTYAPGCGPPGLIDQVLYYVAQGSILLLGAIMIYMVWRMGS